MITRTLIVVLGCTSLFAACTTTRPSQRQDAALAERVAAYQEEQRKRVDELNRQYRRTQARLLETLTKLSVDEGHQSFRLDAQRISDLLLATWPEATLPARFRDSFEKTVREQRAKIDELERRLADARAAYAEAYKEARLDVARLGTVRGALIAVSQPDQARNLSQLVTIVSKIYHCLSTRPDADAPAGDTGAASGQATTKGECK